MKFEILRTKKNVIRFDTAAIIWVTGIFGAFEISKDYSEESRDNTADHGVRDAADQCLVIALGGTPQISRTRKQRTPFN